MLNSLLFILGIAVGSFVNVVIFRLNGARKRAIEAESGRANGIFLGRSKCLNCNTQLKWYDLIPLLSYFMLQGKCRYCKAEISTQYPLVEFYSGIMLVVTFWFFARQSIALWIASFLFLELFLLILIIDARHLIIPDSIMLAMIFIAAFYWLAPSYGNIYAIFSVTNILSGFIIGGIFYLLWFFTKGEKMGLGDVKLIALLGLLFGYGGFLIVFYIAVAGALIFSLILLALKRADMKTRIPFGSFLAGASIIYILLIPFLPPDFGVFNVISGIF